MKNLNIKTYCKLNNIKEKIKFLQSKKEKTYLVNSKDKKKN